MQKKNRLAAIINHLTEEELANITPEGARAIMDALRLRPDSSEAHAAIKRVALLLLRDDPTDATPPAARLLH